MEVPPLGGFRGVDCNAECLAPPSGGMGGAVRLQLTISPVGVWIKYG